MKREGWSRSRREIEVKEKVRRPTGTSA